MAINKSYIRPHTEVYQFLDSTIASTGEHLTACILGAQYDLYRYGKEVTEGTTPPVSGSDNKLSIDYTYATSNPNYKYSVDKKHMQVYVEDVALADGGYSSATHAYLLADPSEPSIYRAYNSADDGNTLVDVAPGGQAPIQGAFANRPLKVGDLLQLKGTGSGASVDSILYKVTALVRSETSGNYDGVQLNAMPSISSSPVYFEIVNVCDNYSGVAAVEESDVTATTIKISNNIEFESDSRTHTILAGHGKLYPEFRVLLGGWDDEEIHVIGSVEQLQQELGTIDTWNELAYGVYCALKGSQSRQVYAIRVPSDDLKGYRKAMLKTDADPFPYTFVPLVDGSGSEDDDIVRAVVDYCNDKSDPEVQMWRQTIAGIDSPATYAIKFVDQTGDVTVTTQAESEDNYYLVKLPSTSNYSFRRLSVNGAEGSIYTGDIVTVGGKKSVVKSVVADNVIEVYTTETGFTGGVIAITKANTSQNHIAYLHGLAQHINSRRGVLVWCDGGVYDGKSISNAYIAAEIAGLCSAVLPQQSITLTEIQSIASCANMYLKYTQKELDTVAAGGILVVTQDNKYGVPYIRHQLTTDNLHGSLYSEMSITRNLDNISYAVSDVIKGYCGRANVTANAMSSLKSDIRGVLIDFMHDSVDAKIGPSLVNFYGLTVQQDPKHKDMVIVNVTYELPLPMNVIKVYQMVYAATITLAEAA